MKNNFIDEVYNSLNALSDENKFAKDPKPPLQGVSPDKNKDLSDVDKAVNIWLKTIFASHVLIITYGWLIFLGLLLLAVAFFNAYYKRPLLSDSVLISLISGTSLTGLIAIILGSLFKK